MTCLGFVGFGEAAFHIARGLRSEGFSYIFAFDIGINSNNPYKETLKQRAETANVPLCNSIEELVSNCDVIIIAVPARFASEAAEEVLQYVRPGMLVVDITTALPDFKENEERLFDEKGALYVDSAMLGPLPVYEHKVPMLASGKGAVKWHDMMMPYNMSIEVINGNAGVASRIKLVRSVFMKGLEALLVETFLFARKCGVENIVLESISQTINKVPFKKTVERLICGDLVHSERRSYEVGEAITLMHTIGVIPAITEGTKKRLELTTQTGVATKLGGIVPKTLEEAFSIWDKEKYC